ncbi:hypothetical protein Dsin_022489 [Dipteronia sinensis]|uniref:Uncharacterized protein n=1 Tax=Dipteronia sinensis TaxID=43782 RepID=A0AAE0E042_9ROSI|nr:hypothetical protein Dsin_022489 [Dipteronia sinensis]
MGLLARWIWRFSNEEAPLWKRVICARYGVDDSKLSWNWQGPSSSSSCFIKAVASLLKPGTRSKEVLTDGWRIVLGNGIRDSNEAELMAIEKVTQLCASNPSMMGRDITIVSNSKVTVSWINEAGFGNINHVDMVYSVCHYLASLGGTVVSFASRASNSLAENLAKLGSSIAGDFIHWGDI